MLIWQNIKSTAETGLNAHRQNRKHSQSANLHMASDITPVIMIKSVICFTANKSYIFKPHYKGDAQAECGAMLHSHTGDKMENEVLRSQRVTKEDVREVSEQLGSDWTHLTYDTV